jgi:hypothetical protein
LYCTKKKKKKRKEKKAYSLKMPSESLQVMSGLLLLILAVTHPCFEQMLCNMVRISEEYVRSNFLSLKMEAAGIHTCKEKLFTYKTGERMFIRNVD